MYFIIEVAPDCGRKLSLCSLNSITESGVDLITEVIVGILLPVLEDNLPRVSSLSINLGMI
jgi:hypothetical protein